MVFSERLATGTMIGVVRKWITVSSKRAQKTRPRVVRDDDAGQQLRRRSTNGCQFSFIDPGIGRSHPSL